MFYVTLLSVATLWVFSVLSPGPNFLMIVRLSIVRSRREGLQAVAGIGTGTAIWGAAGCFGVQALFLAAPWTYLTLKIAGAAYLIFAGTQFLWQSRRRPADANSGTVHFGPQLSPFRLGLLTTLANPWSAVSVASIFATTMPSDPSLVLSCSVTAVMVTMSVTWYALVAWMFTVPFLAAGYRRLRQWIDRIAGACLVLFGLKLAVEH
jgi:threonine efflux protein